MISVLISVALSAVQPAELLPQGKNCVSGVCSASTSRKVTTTKKVEAKTCRHSKVSTLRSNRFSGFRRTCR